MSKRSYFGASKADVGFIACNTAHIFFKDFESLVSFKLVSLLEAYSDYTDKTVLCSPTSRKLNLFPYSKYVSEEDSRSLGKVISSINNGDTSPKIEAIANKYSNVVIGCTELSMLAYKENLRLEDTLETVIERLVREL